MNVAAQPQGGASPPLGPLTLVLSLLLGCVRSPVEECLELLAGGEERAAVQACQQTFELGRDPRAGLAVARALRAVGESERALEWVEVVEDSAEAAGAAELAGGIHRERGELDEALEAYRRAASLYRETGEHEGAWRAAYTLFYMSWELARYRDAFRWAWRSYEDALRAADRSLQATSLGGLASILFEVGDLEGTQRVVRAALDATPPEEATDRARLLMLEGVVQLRNGRPALARASFEQALRSADPAAEPRFFRSVHLDQVDADLRLGEWAAAERHLNEARRYGESGAGALAESFYAARIDLARGQFSEAATALDAALEREADVAWRWNLLYRRGEAREGLGDWPGAERDYQGAIEMLEGLRRELAFDELKVWLLDERRQPFEALVALQARRRGAAVALETAERAKARVFVDSMVRSARADSSSERGLELDHALVERAGALAGLLPALTSSAAVEPRPLDELLQVLGTRHVREYFVTQEEVWLFSVDGEEIRGRCLDLPTTELAELVARFSSNPGDPRLAERLGATLLPEEVVPPRGSRIEIVSDGFLGSVPFAALRRRDRFLVEDLVLSYVPSLNALANLSSPVRRSGSSVRVVGDPLQDLPAAAAEAREVAAYLGVEALVGEQAALGELEPAARVRHLHLATHTGLGATGPWLTLADGVVDASAILAGRLGGEVVILASCASAARKSKGLWGSLGAAFLAAGSRAVVASLWSVDDRAAARLVRLFYANEGPADPARALAEAQRQLVAVGEPPQEWAGFVVFGPNQPMSMD